MDEERRGTIMIDPHIGHSCSVAGDEVAEVTVDDVSLDFGDGARVVSCRCGSWAIEDESGMLLAWSMPQIVDIRVLALSGAA
ncbi:MAG: hypothetical protein JWR33_1807 [Naasia sp.]|nr:hypothetical protein [Naasia sp.]